MFTALDEGGHKRSCTTVLTVRDVTPPTITCGAFEGVVPATVRPGIEDACGATGLVRAVTCTPIGDDGGEVGSCPAVPRGETVEVTGRPAAVAMTVSYVIEALDVSGNLTTVTCSFEMSGDRDQDGVIDLLDVCIEVPNPEQSDEDGDGVGDVCDVCPTIADPEQVDSNRDGVGDACKADPGGWLAGGGGGCESGGTSLFLVALLALGLVLKSRRARRRAGGDPL